MNGQIPIKDTYPALSFTSILQAGLKAYNLALDHQAEIDPCLPGKAKALHVDLTALGVVVPGALQARHEAQVATATQNGCLKQGYARVRAIRQTVRKSGASRDIQRAYGIGQTTNPALVRDVKAALQQIVDRASADPAEAAMFGIIDATINALQTLVQDLTDIDRTQEEKRATAPLTTKERNLTAHRILQATIVIAGTGMIAFADDPTTHASFAALMASTRRSERSKTPKLARPKAKAPAAPAAADATPPSVGPHTA